MDKKQQEIKQEIASFSRKTDYYDILGVSKAANDAEIKKAYRNLALRFHPDKNQYEGAKDVFKKVSNAYSTLIDPNKKAHYDRYGPQSQNTRPQHRQAYANGHQDDEFQQYDDLFRAFFGGMPMHGHRRGNVYTYSFGGNQAQQGEARQGSIGLYAIFIVLFILYTVGPLFSSRPNYSNHPSSQYKYRAKTPLLNVQFYVNQQYFEEAKNHQYKKHAEMEIDREYIVHLEKQCELAKRDKRRIEEAAYRQRPGATRDHYIEQARQINMYSCKTLTSFRTNFEDYLRDLAYMK